MKFIIKLKIDPPISLPGFLRDEDDDEDDDDDNITDQFIGIVREELDVLLGDDRYYADAVEMEEIYEEIDELEFVIDDDDDGMPKTVKD